MDRIVSFGLEENLVGILSEAEAKHAAIYSPGVIILNAGLIHRVGPNRSFTKLARHLTSRGFDVLRFDLSGIGDSNYRKDNMPFSKSSLQEVSMAMDFLNKILQKESFILVGLCSGAAVSFQSGYEDRRVIAMALLNPVPPEESVGQELQDFTFYEKNAIFKFNSWVRLFIGKSNYSMIMKVIKNWILKLIMRKSSKNSEPGEIKLLIESAFKKFQTQGQHVLIVSSGSDIGLQYLRQTVANEMKIFQDSGLLRIEVLHEADHTFTTIASQLSLFKILQEWVEKISTDRLKPDPIKVPG